jgi:hypothetical protein
MIKYPCSLFVILLLSTLAFSQVVTGVSGPKAGPEKPSAADSAPMDLAKATLAAHGGDKLKRMKSLVVKGTVELSAGTPQTIPATFAMITSGNRYFFELDNPFQPFKQVFDGQRTYSAGMFELPPMTSLGFPLLPKVGDTGYVVSAVPEGKKKRRGFRITTPEGFYTDFYIDEKTSQIKGYESSYDMNGRTVTTSVQIDEMQTIEGVVVPKRYSQRFDIGQTAFYADFRSKEILINTPVPDSYFVLK